MARASCAEAILVLRRTAQRRTYDTGPSVAGKRLKPDATMRLPPPIRPAAQSHLNIRALPATQTAAIAPR